MHWAWIIAILLVSAYALLIFTCLVGWISTTRTDLPRGGPGAGKASIVIPARNEAAQIGYLLGDLGKQSHPEKDYEIIIVNDHSSDQTAGVVNSFASRCPNIRLLDLEEGENGKKTAIKKGVSLAKHEIIVSTDADCRAPGEWLENLVAAFGRKGVRMVAGPVLLYPDRGWFRAMQSLEFLGLVGVSAGVAGLGSPIMCNAANMAYLREDYFRFLQAGGDRSESGDDMFFLLWLKNEHPGSIRYLISPDAAITTRPSPTLSAFLMQRFRWVSKSRFYRDWLLNSTALAVFLTSACLLMAAVLCFVSARFIFLLGVLVLIKTTVDTIFMNEVLKHFGKKKWLPMILPLELVYFVYVSVVGIAGQFIPHTWKGRNIQP